MREWCHRHHTWHDMGCPDRMRYVPYEPPPLPDTIPPPPPPVPPVPHTGYVPPPSPRDEGPRQTQSQSQSQGQSQTRIQKFDRAMDVVFGKNRRRYI